MRPIRSDRKQVRIRENVDGAIPGLSEALSTHEIQAHVHNLFNTGSYVFVLPDARSISRPFCVSAARRLFQAVAPIFWSGKYSASAAAVHRPSPTAVRILRCRGSRKPITLAFDVCPAR